MLWRGLLALAVIAAGLGWYVTGAERVAEADVPAHTPDLENGALVFAIGGCASCHVAPGASDKTVLAGGLLIHSEFGTFAVPNISSDATHGIGAWSAADFLSAMKLGTAPDGRHYYPAFPFTAYARTRDGDLLDLFAYLKTLPADATPSAPHALGFPFSISRGIGLWKLLYATPDPVLPEDGLSEAALRGRYLVEGPGHCAECHTPRDALGGLDMARWMAGGPNPDGPGRIPNITPAKLTWSESDIAYYLESGFTPDFDSAGGSMVAVIENTAKLPPEDRAAIAAYLTALPPRE
ncbi:MAG: cytochrome c [Pseudomonadota bacterium]